MKIGYKIIFGVLVVLILGCVSIANDTNELSVSDNITPANTDFLVSSWKTKNVSGHCSEDNHSICFTDEMVVHLGGDTYALRLPINRTMEVYVR